MSGTIFGISLLSAGAKQAYNVDFGKAFDAINSENFMPQVGELHKLTDDVQKLINELFVLRKSIELPPKDQKP
jgi:hypothetical protein